MWVHDPVEIRISSGILFMKRYHAAAYEVVYLYQK